MENSKWGYCEKDNHAYAQYENSLGKQVCFQCDPLSDNNWHRPAAKDEAARILRIDSQFFINNPVWFFRDDWSAAGYRDVDFNEVLTCPFCLTEIDWYETNGITKFSCRCSKNQI